MWDNLPLHMGSSGHNENFWTFVYLFVNHPFQDSCLSFGFLSGLFPPKPLLPSIQLTSPFASIFFYIFPVILSTKIFFQQKYFKSLFLAVLTIAGAGRILIVSSWLQLKAELFGCTDFLVCSQNQSVHMFVVLWHSSWFFKAGVSLTAWLSVLWIILTCCR